MRIMNDTEVIMQKKLEQSTAYRVRNFDNDIHSMPQDDLFEHLADANCPCSPFLDPVIEREILRGLANRHVWVHVQIKYNREDLI